MVKDSINELNIHCVYDNRGCQKVIQLQHLDRHENNCGFTPVVCTNEGCGAIVNKQDLTHHESEQCEYRKLKCHSCGEMMITLANMETKIANDNVDTNVARMEQKIEKRIVEIKADVEAVNHEVKGLKTTWAESFDQIKDVLVKMEGRIKENATKIGNTSNGGKDKIFIAGGVGTDSVEILTGHKNRGLYYDPCRRCVMERRHLFTTTTWLLLEGAVLVLNLFVI